MPYVLIEAAHLGLPMVVTRAAGSALLQTGPATLRVSDVGDVRNLARSCIELIDCWPDRMPGVPDQRFTLQGMATLTELAYRGQALDLSSEPIQSGRSDVTEMMSAVAATSAATGTGSLPIIRPGIAPTMPTVPTRAPTEPEVEAQGSDGRWELIDPPPATVTPIEVAARRRHLAPVPQWQPTEMPTSDQSRSQETPVQADLADGTGSATGEETTG